MQGPEPQKSIRMADFHGWLPMKPGIQEFLAWEPREPMGFHSPLIRPYLFGEGYLRFPMMMEPIWFFSFGCLFHPPRGMYSFTTYGWWDTSYISADPSLRGSAPRSLVCVCLVPDHTPAGVRVFRKRSFSTCCATFRHFFYLLFRMAWVRIWMLFECFGSASPRALEAGDSSFLARSVGDVSAVFRAAVSHGLGTYSLGINPAAVPLFRKRFSKSFLFRMVWASILLAFLRVP